MDVCDDSDQNLNLEPLAWTFIEGNLVYVISAKLSWAGPNGKLNDLRENVLLLGEWWCAKEKCIFFHFLTLSLLVSTFVVF